MLKVLHTAVFQETLLGTDLPMRALEEWLSLHQIDGNNYTFVYNLQEDYDRTGLAELYMNREERIDLKLWDINPENDSEDLDKVMPNLDDIKLIGVHRNDEKGTYTISFVAPCEVTGSGFDGATRVYKKLFFTHCVFIDGSKDIKVIFNPTSNLLNVNGTKKGKNHDWTPIANMFFSKVKEYIGSVYIYAPNWIPRALYQFAEDVSFHHNDEITAASFNAEEKIEEFSEKLLNDANIDINKEPALLTRLIQDIQLSFEAQLLEIHGTNEEENKFTVFKQRSDGFTHVISVESTQEGLLGSGAQAAKRSRQDGSIELLGINYKGNDRMYKFLVEQGTEAYLIRGTNTFIEEEVVDIVIGKLNEYREQIQSLTHSGEGGADGASRSEAD